jgi:hypothetical protein
MVVPTIVSISREVLLSMPRSLRAAALGLGATRAEAIAVTLDTARPGLLGAIILALGRALGETMAVTMVIGNTNRSRRRCSPRRDDGERDRQRVHRGDRQAAPGRAHRGGARAARRHALVNLGARLLVIWSTGGRRDVAGAA